MSAGRKRAAYINTGTQAAPAWSHMDRISDVQRGRSRGTADRKYRGAKTVKTVTGYKTNTFTFKYHVKAAKYTTDAVLTKLEQSYEDEVTLDVCFLNQRIVQPTGTFTAGANAVGVRGPVVCVKLDVSEADEEGVTYDVELREVEHEDPVGTLVEIGAYSVAVTAPT